MSSVEQEPRAGLDASDIVAIREHFADPVLQELAIDLVTTIHDLSEQITAVAEDELPEHQDPTYTQEIVDEVVTSIVGSEKTRELKEQSEAFKELCRIVKAGENDYTLFEASVGSIATDTKESRSRADVRSNFRPHFAKAKNVVKFLDSLTAQLSPEQVQTITETIAQPIEAVVEALSAKAPDNIAEELALIRTLDAKTDISHVKLLVYGAINEIFKRKEIDEVYSRDMIHQNPDLATRVNVSPVRSYYHSTELLTDMEQKDTRAWNRELRFMHTAHQRLRFMGIPSRAFKKSTRELYALCKLYATLTVYEGSLERMPTVEESDIELHETTRRNHVASLVAKANYAFGSTFEKLAARQNEKIDQSGSQDERDAIWQEAGEFDKFSIAVAQPFISYLKNLGPLVHAGDIPVLERHASSKVAEQAAKRELKFQLDALAPEIASRQERLAEIDGLYSVTGKQLRERTPDLLILSKQIIEHINHEQPLDTETARALVGLMMGVYWDRTNKNATESDLAKAYLEDAQELRRLSLELAYLGQPQESKLLKLVNLLDEIIDAGFFDDMKKHPEYKVLEDFVLAYIIERDGEPVVETVEPEIEPIVEPEEEPVVETEPEVGPVGEAEPEAEPEVEEPAEEPEPEEEDDGFPAIPTETLGQADYEDIKVFPPGTSADEIIRDYVGGVNDEVMPNIEWERIQRLVELRDHFVKNQLEVQFMRTKHASWQVLPFFILEVKMPGAERGVAVVESPVYGNATYVYREASDRLEWREVVQLTRKEARDWGAVPAVHVDSKRLDIHFRKIWDRVISELTINQ